MFRCTITEIEAGMGANTMSMFLPRATHAAVLRGGRAHGITARRIVPERVTGLLGSRNAIGHNGRHQGVTASRSFKHRATPAVRLPDGGLSRILSRGYRSHAINLDTRSSVVLGPPLGLGPAKQRFPCISEARALHAA